VKDTALLPLRYLLTVLLLVALFGGIDVLHAVGQFDLSNRNVFAHIVADALFVSVPISAIVGAVITLFTILLRPTHRLVKLVGLFVSVSALLVVGVTVTTAFASQTALEAPPTPTIESGRLFRTEDASLYAAEKRGFQLADVVSHTAGDEPGFALSGSAVVDPFERVIRVPETGASLPFDQMELTLPRTLRAPAGIAGVLADSRRLAVTLAVTASSSANAGRALPTARAVRSGAGPGAGATTSHLVALALSIGFVVAAMWSVVRLTRWPLFNALAAAAVVRLLLVLVRAGGDPNLVGPSLDFVGPMLEGYLLAAALGGVGVLLVLFRLFLPPFSAWQREMAHG
jgi:hypothetical protein